MRWNPNGNLLATASEDKRVKILDVQSGKAIHTAATSDQSNLIKMIFTFLNTIKLLDCADSVCFL